MFWASKRSTTRTEDIAYSLMGIFSLRMSLLYGESKRAFIRLQEEIMNTSGNQSTFAWKEISKEDGERIRGPLAKSPAEFAASFDVIPVKMPGLVTHFP
jgi:hypothetical protein